MSDPEPAPPQPDRPARCLVIVPAYNEAGSIRRVVDAVFDALPDADVLVVDDGSTDATARRVPPGAAVISLPFNQGIGGAMQAGYRYAHQRGYAVAVQIDGDGQHPPDQARRLLRRLEAGDADLVVGSRFLDHASYAPPRSRMIGIAFIRRLVSLLTRQRFTDCTSGYRAANRRVIAAFAHWYPEDYPEPEVILLLRRAGFRLAEEPVAMEARTTGTTSIPFAAGVFYLLKVSAALLLDLFRDPWPRGKIDDA